MAEAKRYYRKNVELFLLLDKIRLWPSRSGKLHGIREITQNGDYAIITTHCNKTFQIRNSRTSRAARWLRNKWVHAACGECGVPQWKMEKYSKTFFQQHYGSSLAAGDRRLPRACEKTANMHGAADGKGSALSH